MQLKSQIKKWRKYSELSNLGIIARRKFFNNAFDGALTCAGIVSGNFLYFLSNPGLKSTIIIITGLSTALAIGISGLWGAFLSEEAERKKKLDDLKREMVIIQGENNAPEKIDKSLDELEEIQKAMVTTIKNKKFLRRRVDSAKDKNYSTKNNKSLIERSEKFATIIASLVDGGAPVLGSVLPLIPFFFGGGTLNILHFFVSYVVLGGILIYLGIFLGKISGGGRLKYTLHLIAAGVTTLVVSLILELAISG